MFQREPRFRNNEEADKNFLISNLIQQSLIRKLKSEVNVNKGSAKKIAKIDYIIVTGISTNKQL